jgi:hypothetical protein
LLPNEEAVMTTTKLQAISVFYRNDQPNGIGLTLTDAFGPLERVIDTLADHYELMYREAVQRSELRQLIKDLFGQLDHFSSPENKNRLKLKDILLVIGNVILLEKYGFIKADEFNGMQYCYTEE